MTKKDYNAIADAIRATRQMFAENETANAHNVLDDCATLIAQACRDRARINANGNRVFDAERFLRACDIDAQRAKVLASAI